MPTNRTHPLSIAGVLAALFLTQGCYAHHVRPPNRVGAVTGHRVLWSWLWGAKAQAPDLSNCRDAPLVEVTTQSNLLYSLVNVATLGFAHPVRVEWSCAPAPRDSTLGFAAPTRGAS